MLPLLLAALFGAILGWKGNLPPSWSKHLHRISRGFLLLMLFSLGAKLGASTELHSHLSAIGVQALLLSILTVFGSILVIVIFTALLRSQPDDTARDIASSYPSDSR